MIANVSFTQILSNPNTANLSSVSGGSLFILSNGATMLSIPLANGYVYNQRAIDFFKRVTDKSKTLTEAQKRWYNDSIFVAGINSGYIGTTRAGDSLVFLYSRVGYYCNRDTTIMNMNLLADVYNCVHYGAIIYTDSGAVGDGASGSYSNTFFNPTLDSSIYKCNSASLGFYSKTMRAAANSSEIGCYNDPIASSMQIKFTGNLNYSVLNQVNYTATVDTTTLGCFSISRINGSQIIHFLNGVTMGAITGVQTSSSLPNMQFYVNGANGVGYKSTLIQCFDWCGSGLSVATQKKISDDLNNSLKGVKYNVY